jgi:hypothetical protein
MRFPLLHIFWGGSSLVSQHVVTISECSAIVVKIQQFKAVPGDMSIYYTAMAMK